MRDYNKRPQGKCPPTCEMSVYGEYVYNMYVKKMQSKGWQIPSPLPPQSPSPDQTQRGHF